MLQERTHRISLESTGIDNEARLPHFGKSGMSRQIAFERDYGNSCNPGNKSRDSRTVTLPRSLTHAWPGQACGQVPQFFFSELSNIGQKYLSSRRIRKS
jgi:hypothetical protein